MSAMLLLGELGAGHQPALDDRGGDRVDDALRAAAGAASPAGRARRGAGAAGRITFRLLFMPAVDRGGFGFTSG